MSAILLSRQQAPVGISFNFVEDVHDFPDVWRHAAQSIPGSVETLKSIVCGHAPHPPVQPGTVTKDLYLPGFLLEEGAGMVVRSGSSLPTSSAVDLHVRILAGQVLTEQRQ